MHGSKKPSGVEVELLFTIIELRSANCKKYSEKDVPIRQLWIYIVYGIQNGIANIILRRNIEKNVLLQKEESNRKNIRKGCECKGVNILKAAVCLDCW